jgi:hypothetical protein
MSELYEAEDDLSFRSFPSPIAINFLAGTMGIANAERALSYLRTIAEFISQPEVKDVVPL